MAGVIVGAVLGSSVVTAIVTHFFTRRKTNAEARRADAEAAALITGAAAESVKLLLGRVDDLEQAVASQSEEIRSLKQTVTILTGGVNALTRQIMALGHDPAWKIQDAA